MLSNMNLMDKSADLSRLITSIRIAWSLKCKALARILYVTFKSIIGLQLLKKPLGPPLYSTMRSKAIDA